MTTITADYGAMSAGSDGLVATWARIEGDLIALDSAVAATHDMKAGALVAYETLKAKWQSSAADRQVVLKALATFLADAREHYMRTDAALAAQFEV